MTKLIAALFFTVAQPEYQIVVVDKYDEFIWKIPLRKIAPTVEKLFHELQKRNLKPVMTKIGLFDNKGKFIKFLDKNPFKLQENLKEQLDQNCELEND